jgi:hypothetical protein
MSSTDELLRDLEEQTETDPSPGGAPSDGRRSRRARLRARAGHVFSLRAFLASLAVVAGGVLLAGVVVPSFVPLGGLLGVVLAGFALGLVGWRRYVEVGLAGAAVSGVALLTQYLVFSVVGGLGVPLAAFGAGTGAVAAVLGHYLGRDLRAGLTRDV